MNFFLRAVAIMSLGKLMFAFQDVIVKEMSSLYPMHEIMMIRGLVSIPLLLLVIHFSVRLSALRMHHPGYHVLRGLLMFTALMSFYVALSEISLTTVTALFFTAPFFITLLSIPMLGEKVGPRRFASIGVGFIGVLIVLRPDAGPFNPVMLLPVLAAFLYALSLILIRFAKLTTPTAIMSLYTGLAFAILAPLLGLVFSGSEISETASASTRSLLLPWAVPQGIDWLWLSLTGVTSAFGFMCMSYAYQKAEASRLAPFEYVLIIWVTVLSYLVWSELPDAQTLVGLVLIIGSGIYVFHREKKVEAEPIAHSGLTR